MNTAFWIVSLIGRGPSTPGLLTRIIMLVMGALMVLFAIAPGTRGGGIFARGRESRLINATGRVVLGAAALVLILIALRILR